MVNGPGHAEALLEIGELEKAAQVASESLAVARESGSPIPEAQALRVIGRVETAKSDFERSQKTVSGAAKICEEWKSRILLGQVLLDKVGSSLCAEMPILQERLWSALSRPFKLIGQYFGST